MALDRTDLAAIQAIVMSEVNKLKRWMELIRCLEDMEVTIHVTGARPGQKPDPPANKEAVEGDGISRYSISTRPRTIKVDAGTSPADEVRIRRVPKPVSGEGEVQYP